VAEGGHEHPERGRVEEPVGRSPPDGPAGEGPVLHEGPEPLGQPLDQGCGPIGVEEADPTGHPADDPAGPLLPPGQQVEQPTEGAQQDHAHPGGHDDQDRRRLGLAAMMTGRDMEAVRDQEGHEGAPEHDVQHHGRSDALGAEGEAGVGPGHSRLGEEAVAECGPRSGAARGDVAEGEGRHVDAEQPDPTRAVRGENSVGQLGVGHEGPDLQQHAKGQVADVDVGQGVDFGPVAGQQGQGHVEDEQEDQQGPHAEADLTADEWSAVPPPPA